MTELAHLVNSFEVFVELLDFENVGVVEVAQKAHFLADSLQFFVVKFVFDDYGHSFHHVALYIPTLSHLSESATADLLTQAELISKRTLVLTHLVVIFEVDLLNVLNLDGLPLVGVEQL